MKNPIILGIILLVVTIGLIGGAIWGVLAWLTSVDVGLAGAVTTAIAGFVGLIASQWHSKSREIAEVHRPKKIEVYDTFFEITESFLYDEADKDIENGIPNKLQNQFKKLNRGMIIWASPKVIEAWLAFRRGAGQGGTNNLLLVDDVLKEIRKDLGNSNWNLNRGDLVRIYLSDPDGIKT